MSVLGGALPTLAARPRTLVIMIATTELEATMLGPTGVELGTRVRLPRVPDATLVAELQALWPRLELLGEFDRITVSTTPGSVGAWEPGALAAELARQSLRPARVIAAAELRWRQVIRGVGVELVLALGAELESALFLDGTLVPGLALGRHPFRKGRTYREYLGPRVLERKGARTWNRRLGRVVAEVLAVWHPSTLHLAGPGAAVVELELPPEVVVVQAPESLEAAVALWRVAPPRDR